MIVTNIPKYSMSQNRGTENSYSEEEEKREKRKINQISSHLSVAAEGAARDWLVHGLRGLELGPGVLVPEGVPAVRPHGGQGAVHRVEGDVVDGVDVLEALGDAVGAVALEGEVVLGVLRVHVLDGHATLNAAKGEA